MGRRVLGTADVLKALLFSLEGGGAAEEEVSGSHSPSATAVAEAEKTTLRGSIYDSGPKSGNSPGKRGKIRKSKILWIRKNIMCMCL
ncbi:Hypothetical protein NTJ_05092 [Nesidiocoris tenuis]|uniref:Uncharacterized protein n=1 Tax=Nesidiocoris tenuis TaxID=355587 RepID=A0ABN7AJP4_9HEMI|nr:Hypothetical protein NTJ_05092 [Nesidiocoris tenuis]